MKKRYALFIIFCLSLLSQPTSAETNPQIQRISLAEATVKIRKKENFYLFIGRMDHVDSQLALQQLPQVASQSGATIYFLDTKGSDPRRYRTFSKKYAIRSSAYLAYFSNGKQTAIYHNNWRQKPTELLPFLSKGQ